MSDDEFGPFNFAFGEGAAEEFKERLKEFMRAQKAAFDEIQGESGGQIAPVDRWQVVSQAVVLAAAGLSTVKRQATPDEAADAMGLMFARALAALQGAITPTP
ncbi:MAG: hypothetical protein U0Y82_07840 [Thermoleophilia bacterium]